jgi:fucose 4-O-acetylase-like acetyltransferase
MSATLTRLPSTTGPASRTTPSPDGPRAATAKSRDPWFDNAKLLLVVLVVVGHSWTLVAHTFTTSWAYNFLYLWHVPAFVMVTGYLSRSFRFTRRHLTKLLTSVVVPYVVFEYTLTTFRSVVGGEHHGPLFLNPHWPMWYLATLFVWRLATPLLKRMPYALPAAVVVSLIGGAFTGDTLDLARATGLLPFFVIGLLATPEQLEVLRRPTARLAALGAFGLALVASSAIEDTLGSEWLYYRSSYAQLHESLVAGALTRLVLLVASGALAVAFVTLVPRRALWFTKLGSATLVVYLFHGFLVKLAEYSAFPHWSGDHPVPSLVAATFVAVPVALLLAAPPVASRLNMFVDPVGAWQRHRRRQATPAARPSDSHVGTFEPAGTRSSARATRALGA